MKKQLVALSGLMLASSMAFAAPAPGTWGIGASHGSDHDSTLYAPYMLSNDMWVEPFLSFSWEKRHSGNEGKTYNYRLGVGLFKDIFQTPQTHAYAGGRLGYSRVEVKPDNGEDSTTDGVMVQPTLGFAYSPIDNIDVGAEAYLTWDHGHRNNDTDNLDTGTALFVRYYFGQ